MRNIRFTLIELLVVVAILGILLSLLVPSLSKARAAAHVVTCVTSTAEISKGAHMWAIEDDGKLPYSEGTSVYHSKINSVLVNGAKDHRDNFAINHSMVFFNCIKTDYESEAKKYGMDYAAPTGLGHLDVDPWFGKNMSFYSSPSETLFFADTLYKSSPDVPRGRAWFQLNSSNFYGLVTGSTQTFGLKHPLLKKLPLSYLDGSAKAMTWLPYGSFMDSFSFE